MRIHCCNDTLVVTTIALLQRNRTLVWSKRFVSKLLGLTFWTLLTCGVKCRGWQLGDSSVAPFPSWATVVKYPIILRSYPIGPSAFLALLLLCRSCFSASLANSAMPPVLVQQLAYSNHARVARQMFLLWLTIMLFVVVVKEIFLNLLKRNMWSITVGAQSW